MPKLCVDDIVQHQSAKVNGVRLHYVETSDSLKLPTVLLLHGFPDFWHGWRRQIPALHEAGFRVVAPDLRGYNLSAKPQSTFAYSIDHLSRDVAALIQHLRVERAHVVGHDWGGIIAWWTALHYPRAVDRLAVLNAPHPVTYLREVRSLDQMRRSWYALFFQLPWLPEHLMRANDFAALRAVWRFDPVKRGAWSREDLRRSVEAMAQPGALTAALNYYRAMLRSPRKMLRGCEQISHQTLVLWGERDRYLSSKLLNGLEKWVPDVRIERFPDASHWLQHDAAREVNAHLIEFFSKSPIADTANDQAL